MDTRIIRSRLDTIRRRSVVRRWPIAGWQARTADHLAPGEYEYDGDWQDLVGEGAWPAGKTVFLRAQIETQPDAPIDELYLEFDHVGLEGLLSVDGRPYAGIDANHTRVAVPGAGRLNLEAEFVSLLASLNRPELRQESGRLRGVALIQVDREVEGAYYDLRFAWEASVHVRDERRRQLLHSALEDALLAVDLTSPPGEFSRELAAARGALGDRVGSIGLDPEAGGVFLTGHSHIDVAWLWPLRETVRKCARTFATACRLLERYPDYHFSCSQPQLYAYTREHYPELYQEIERWIRAGRWECTGGMWVEPDCNVPSGESLIRQVLHGLAFFRDQYGARPTVCWLPDVFGYPASLPGILSGCGLGSFMTCKLHWQARNPFPHHLFWWEGIDGSRMLAHIPRLPGYYNGSPNPEQLTQAWDNFNQKAAYAEVLFPFGYGDGGGGPTEEMLEFAARAGCFPGLPSCRQGLEEDYFADVAAREPELPTWVGELYLETHRGTYSTHGPTKRANRKNELLLREAEIAGVLAGMSGAAVDLSPLRAAWSNLLLLQFHDVLPGSSIGEVYREAAEDYARIEAVARGVRDVALRGLADQVGVAGDLLAFNSLSWARGEGARGDVARATLSVSGDGPFELVQPDGRAVPAQVVAQDNGAGVADVIFHPQSLPSMGYSVLSLRAAATLPEHSLRVFPPCVENRFFLIELADDGAVTRLFDKRFGREVLPEGARANDVQLFQDGPEREAAWNVHATFSRREYAWDPAAEIEVVEQGPVRAVVRVARTYRASRLEQDIIIYDRLPRIDFVTRVDWQERQVLMKVAFPVAVRAPQATFEIQFGAVERPTHRNTSWDEEKFEVCGHRWADLSEAGYGVSLLNDSKYGYDVLGNVLRLTLLRGTERPDPDADRGQHAFTYALLPHGGDWRAGETVRRALELNVPVVCVGGVNGAGELPASRAFFEVHGPAVLDTVKPAEDGDGWILRFYEPHGGRGTVVVRGPDRFRRVMACNHVEENGDEESTEGDVALQGVSFSFPIEPYQIKSFRVWPA